jgi:hypothetical protein
MVEWGDSTIIQWTPNSPTHKVGCERANEFHMLRYLWFKGILWSWKYTKLIAS